MGKGNRQEQPQPSYLEQFTTAVTADPPMVFAARVALSHIYEEMGGMDSAEQLTTATTVAELAGQLATKEPTVRAEFEIHAGAFGDMANVLGGAEGAPAAAADMSQAKMGEGKA